LIIPNASISNFSNKEFKCRLRSKLQGAMDFLKKNKKPRLLDLNKNFPKMKFTIDMMIKSKLERLQFYINLDLQNVGVPSTRLCFLFKTKNWNSSITKISRDSDCRGNSSSIGIGTESATCLVSAGIAQTYLVKRISYKKYLHFE
jgi:hypothetical protein